MPAPTNAFGTFLETKELLRDTGEHPETPAAPSEPENALRFSEAVKLLLSSSFPTTLPQLLEASGLALEDFTEAIKRLEAASLITVVRDDGSQLVRLTERGEHLVAA
ncbi:MAG TPA: hypothetical protein VNV37_09115 [Solirubrobacteraceae bacterium]|jgi:hypothetical protein|nr:hypothetical protein [Solirubrobacteraceae bacterium]